MKLSNTLITTALTACLTLLFVGQAQAAKMYKIVDAKGNVTFSQFPPPKDTVKADTKVETKTVNAQSETSVSVEGAFQYCGDIKLPRLREDRDWYLSEISNRKKYWKKDLDREQKYLNKQTRNYNKYSNSSYRLESMGKKGKKIRDLRCAINWASSHKDDISQVRGKRSDKLGSLQGKLDTLNGRRDDSCGTKPEYDPTEATNKKRLKSWSQCNKSYKYDIRKLERMIRTESNKLGRLN